MRKLLIASLLLFATLSSFAQKQGPGSITGVILDKSSNSALEFAKVILKNKKDNTVVLMAMTDKDGKFLLSGVPYGDYVIAYSFIGYQDAESQTIQVVPKQKRVDMGSLYTTATSQTLNEVTVTGKRSTLVTSIDRKTFNVGSDLMSKAGSVSDLMQNIPSVQVDVDGNVSMRGSDDVTILIDGKPSAMMKLNSAAALQQIPASAIERIEIIANPSAKYKPDGTSGIINLVMKKDKGLGLNGNVTANVGNDERENVNAMINYNPGKLNVFASFGFKQDARNRINDITTRTSDAGQLVDASRTHGTGSSRPVYNLATAGADYKFNDHNKLSISGNYNYRFQRQHDVSTYMLQNALGDATLDYDRARRLPETESDLEITSSFQHQFDKEGHELDINYMYSHTLEDENNYYTNYYRKPDTITRYDNMFYHHINNESEFSVEYTRPYADKSKLESGYVLEYFNNNMNLFRDTLALASNIWNQDFTRSNHFIRSEYTHVLYVTYEKEVGKFSFLAGLRYENTLTRANLVTKDSIINIKYPRLYPSLHLSYDLTKDQKLQLNYSHRIRRPQDEELNPFPEYQDLQNVRIGNPHLKPEDIHSVELGYQIKKKNIALISTLYYRYNYNGITSIVNDLGNGVLQSTLENLSKNQSSGLELIFSGTLGKFGNINLSTNTFYNTIDASSLGYSNNKSIFTWSANGSIGLDLTRSTVWQINSNYSAKVLTPQGTRIPGFVMNTALKQEVFKKKASLILTVSDIFNTLKNSYILDTPDLYRDEMRKRTARVVYLGFAYTFGNNKQKENSIKYDNQM
ncbi:MAG: outer membrane beta-barrel family protein [Bacteroidota bacterium]|nr:outer membrane beta-barrel family protein [Bacteroidota bacterium]